MLHLEAVSDRRPARIRGRSQRTQSIGTKLTVAEEADVLAASQAAGKVPSEWVRDLIIRELRPGSSPVLLPEILGVRLLLVNVLRPLVLGQKLTAETFDRLLDEIGTAKFELASKLLTDGRR